MRPLIVHNSDITACETRRTISRHTSGRRQIETLTWLKPRGIAPRPTTRLLIHYYTPAPSIRLLKPTVSYNVLFRFNGGAVLIMLGDIKAMRR